MGCIKELKEAVNQIDNGDPVAGDLLFNGDMQMWIKFANSQRLIAALRMSDANPTVAMQEFTEAMIAGVIQSNQENIMYPDLAESNNENPWYSAFRTRTDFALSNTLVDLLFNLIESICPSSPLLRVGY